MKAAQINAEAEHHGQSHRKNLSGDQFVVEGIYGATVAKCMEEMTYDKPFLFDFIYFLKGEIKCFLLRE